MAMILFKAYLSTSTQQHLTIYQDGNIYLDGNDIGVSGGSIFNFDRIEFFDNSHDADEGNILTLLNTVTGLATNKILYDPTTRTVEICCGIRNLIGNRLNPLPGDPDDPEVYPGKLSYILWDATIAIVQTGSEFCLKLTRVKTDESYYWKLGTVPGGGFIAPSQFWQLGADDDLKLDIASQALGLIPLKWGQFRTSPQKAYYRFCYASVVNVEDPLDASKKVPYRAYVLQFERCIDVSQLTNASLQIKGLKFEFQNTDKFWLFQQQSPIPKEMFVGVFNLENEPAINFWMSALAKLEQQIDGVEGSSATMAPAINFEGSIFGVPLKFRDVHDGAISTTQGQELPSTLIPAIGPVQPMPIEERAIPGSSHPPAENPEYSAKMELRRFSPAVAGNLSFEINPIRLEFITEGFVEPDHKEKANQLSREIQFLETDVSDAQVVFSCQFYEYVKPTILRLGELDLLVSSDKTEHLALNAGVFRFWSESPRTLVTPFSANLNLQIDAVQFASSLSDSTRELSYLTLLKSDNSLVDSPTVLRCAEKFAIQSGGDTRGSGAHHINFELHETGTAPADEKQPFRSVVVLSEQPFFVGQISGTPITQRNSDSDSPVLGFCEHITGQTSGWQLRGAKALSLDLGPQGIGEELDNYSVSIADPKFEDLTPGEPAAFHFTPGVTISLNADSSGKTYLPPLWNLSSLILDQKPEISFFKYESLYSLSCAITPNRSVLEEMSQDIGVIPSLASDWSPISELPGSLSYSSANAKWIAARKSVSARPIVLTPKNLDIAALSDTSFPSIFETRTTSHLKTPPAMTEELPGHDTTDGVATGLSWLLTDVLSNEKYKQLWALRLGQGSVTKTSFTSLGVTGTFEAQYELPPSSTDPNHLILRITSDSTIGRQSKIVAILEGRIGVLGNRALYVKTFERTVATLLVDPATNPISDKDLRPGLKLTKKEVVIVDKIQTYPDMSTNVFNNGFVLSSQFATDRWENVPAPDANGIIPLPLSGKHVVLNLARDAEGNATPAKLADSNLLYFKTIPWKDRAAQSNFDYPAQANGEPEHVSLPSANQPSSSDFFNSTDSDADLPESINVTTAYQNQRYYFAFEPTKEPVNILFGKERKAHLVNITHIVLSRLQMTDRASGSNPPKRIPTKNNNLSVVYAIWKPINTKNVRVNRPKVLGFFSAEAESATLEPVVTNCCALLINRDPINRVKDMSYRIPFNGISEHLTPAWKKQIALAPSWTISQIFPTMSGIQLDGMVNYVSPDVFNNSILTFDQSVEGKDLAALAQMKTKLQVPDIHLFSKYFVKVDLENVFLNSTTGFDLLSGAQLSVAETNLTADWTVSFGAEKFLICEKLSIGMRNGAFTHKFGGSVKMPGLLSWLSRLFSKTGGSGASITHVSFTGSASFDGIEAGLNMSLPNVNLGLFSLSNFHLLTGITLYWNPEWIVGIRLSLARQQKPFSATIFGYDGGGWFYVLANYHIANGNLDYCVGIGIICGVHKSVNFAGIKGSASLTLGFKADYCNGNSQAGLRVTLFLLIEGELDFYGIASAKISIYLAGTYTDSPSDALILVGEIRIEIDICWCFTLTVHKRAETRIALGGSTNFDASLSYYGRTESDFLQYATNYVNSLE